jgi:hypothetical protein
MNCPMADFSKEHVPHASGALGQIPVTGPPGQFTRSLPVAG